MTAPLTPANCDLTDFPYMPLDVKRLRDSELASNETPEACWAAVMVWCASWHQVPAASIPNDDRWIAQQAGYARRGKIEGRWKGVRPGAMRGWIECDDGRLYHPVVAEKALTAWKEKLEQRYMSECARVKKHNQRHHTNVLAPSFDQWISLGCPQGQRLPVPGDKQDCPSGQAPPVPGTTTTCPPNVPRDKHSKGREVKALTNNHGVNSTIVPAVDNLAKKLKTNGAIAPERQTQARWWTTEQGIVSRGQELGVQSLPGESMQQYKDRLFQAEHGAKRGHHA